MPARVGRVSPSRHILANQVSLTLTTAYLCPEQFMPAATATAVTVTVTATQNGTVVIWFVDPAGALHQVVSQGTTANNTAIISLSANIGPLMVQFTPAAACTLSVEASYAGGMTQ